MAKYEYRVLPAPERGKRGRGLKNAAERFAHALELTMNEMAAEGWDFLRAETLPCEDRAGLLSARVRTEQNVLVFRRARMEPATDAVPVRPPESPEEIAEAAAASLRAPGETDHAPSLGSASRSPAPRPERPLGPAAGWSED